MLRLGVLVSGGGTNLQAIMDAIAHDGLPARIVSVISSNPKAYALERAQKAGIPAVCFTKKDYPDQAAYDAAVIREFQDKQVELVLTAGFMVIMGENFVRAFSGRIMNVHPALIPAFSGKGFYGLHVHEAVLAKGVKVTGATVHFVNEETDDGPIILQKPVFVHDDDTPETLQRRVMEEAEWVIYPQAIRLFAEGKLRVEGNIVKGAMA